jgi:hypothetical protein
MYYSNKLENQPARDDFDFRSPPLRPPLAAVVVVAGAIFVLSFITNLQYNNIRFYLLYASPSGHNHYARAFKMRVFIYIYLLSVSNVDKHMYSA